ncbi:MAG: hypothetical protein EOP21_00290 [Hyphomicrobiales bacterium]|nr:MAG: hypothetical protein EOP21_00290 [Hyphomicrobiales bacterium]
MAEPKITISPLSQSFARDGLTVDVKIYRVEGSEDWTLEVVDGENNSVVWTEPFASDQEAWDEFVSGVATLGLAALMDPDDIQEITVH